MQQQHETANLITAHSFLNKQTSDIDEKEKHRYAQLLDPSILQETHEILMRNLLAGKTAGGKFSTNKRTALVLGNSFNYPTFRTEDIAFAAVTALVDIYNSSATHLKNKLSENTTEETLTNIFRLIAKVLFTFLQLHPFADGNGRLGRLLCSYFLEIICPFPSAIYNIYSPTEKSDYVDILVKARKGINFNRVLESKEEAINFVGEIFDHNESDLTALIVESNWCTWREFLGIKD